MARGAGRVDEDVYARMKAYIASPGRKLSRSGPVAARARAARYNGRDAY